jgi:hypothetical protein
VWKRDFHVRLNTDGHVSSRVNADGCEFADHIDNPDDLYRQGV